MLLSRFLRPSAKSPARVSTSRLHPFVPICLLMQMATTVAGAEPKDFSYPLALAATDDGVVYIADRQLPGIWKIESGTKSVFFQGSKTLQTPLNAVRCVAIDRNGILLAGDSSTRDVYRIDAAGEPTSLTNGKIGIPMSIAVAEDGTIYTADLELHRIWKMPSAGSSNPEEFAVINSPRGLTLAPDGMLWVLSASSEDGQIQMVRPDGTIEPFIDNHPFRLPHNIVRTPDGWFYVTDNYNRCIWKVSPGGEYRRWLQGQPLDRPVGLCFLHDDLLIADPHIKTIFRATREKSLTVFAGSPDQQRGNNNE